MFSAEFSKGFGKRTSVRNNNLNRTFYVGVCFLTLALPALAATSTKISLTPSSVALTAAQTQQFNASVVLSPNLAVRWTLEPAIGSLSTGGLYTAPVSIDTTQTITVTATSVASPSVSASAKVTLTPLVTVSVTPASATVAAAQTKQFTSTVQGSSNKTVLWTLSPNLGAISTTGLYTAPASVAANQSVSVSATSVANPSKSASASILLVSPLKVSTAAIPGGASGMPFSATVTATGSVAPYTWSLLSGTLPSGLSLSSYNGVISGTPVAGSYSFTLRVSDTIGNQATQSYSTTFTSSYYVSQNGSDAWSGLLPSPNASKTDGPFQTLTKAQSAMRASSAYKTAVLRTGTYSIASNLIFNWADTGETWIAYAGETPVLAGEGKGIVSVTGVSNLTFQGITFQDMGVGGVVFLGGKVIVIRSNTFLNCNTNCISASSFNNSIVDNNIVNGQSSVDSAVKFWYGSSNNRVTHNLIVNCQGGGINFAAGRTDPPNDNNIVDRNILQNVNISSSDQGAIYMADWSHSTVGNQITNNIINGNGVDLKHEIKAIYLDDLMSNTLVSGNICRSCGQWAWQIHSGNNNTIVNNIWDLSSGAQIGLYQNNPTEYTDFGMTGNVIERNIIYFSGAPPAALHQVYVGSYDVLPVYSTNLFYSASGAAIPTAETMIDTNRFYANPQFASPAAGNYIMPSFSPAYSLIGFQALPTDQGPVGMATANVVAVSSGALSGLANSDSSSVDLTAEGTTDWVQWGIASAETRKRAVTWQLSGYSILGSGAVQFYNNDPRAIAWSDGITPISGQNNGGVYINSGGLSFTAPADQSTHVLVVHVGGYFSGGTLTAHLSDGSAADFVDTTSTVNGQYDREYTLTYHAASAGQKLTVGWMQTSGTGNVTLSAAALQ